MRKRKDGSAGCCFSQGFRDQELFRRYYRRTIARDITAAKEGERRIRLLMCEVNHRVKTSSRRSCRL